MRWERGHPATLIFYDEADAELERHVVEQWEVERIRDTLQARGFHHVTKVMPKPRGVFGLGHDSGKADRATKRTQPVHTQAGR